MAASIENASGVLRLVDSRVLARSTIAVVSSGSDTDETRMVGVPDDALGFRSADRRAVLSAGAPTAG